MKGFFKVLLGLGIGAAIGMLFAPKSGKELRGQLVGSATRKTLHPAPSWEPESEAATEWPAAVAVEELVVEAGLEEPAAVVETDFVSVAPEPMGEPPVAEREEDEGVVEVIIEETVVREESVITEDGVVEDVVTMEEREVEVIAVEETSVDDLRARIEATRAEVETSLAEPFGGPALVEDVGESGPAEESLAEETPGGDAYVAETVVEETVVEETVVEETVVEETVVEETVVEEIVEEAVIAEEATVSETITEEEPIGGAVAEEADGPEPVLVWSEAEQAAPAIAEDADAQAAPEAGADEAESFQEQPETRRTWDTWREERPQPVEAAADVTAEVETEPAVVEEIPVVAHDEVAGPEPQVIEAEPAWAEPAPEPYALAAVEDTVLEEPVVVEEPSVAAVDEPVAVEEPVVEEVIVAEFVPAEAEPAPEQPVAPALGETVIESAPLAPAPVPETAPIVATEPAPVPGFEPQDAAPEPVADEPAEASLRDTGTIDQAEMRRRIEETRARLKAKAFDAMMSGEAALLGRDDEGSLPRHDDVELDGDVASTIDESLSQEEY